MKKLLSMLLCGAMLVTLAACGGGESNGGTASGQTASGGAAEGEASTTSTDTLTVVASMDPGTLEPARVDDQGFYAVLHQVYEPLFILTTDGELENWLCESYEYEDDTHLLIHLREGVKFSTGEPLTAEDVLWSFQRIHENSLPSISQIMDLDIAACEVVDDNTLRLVTARPAGTLLKRLAYPGLGIASKKAYDEFGGDWMNGAAIGTGPYEIVEYVAGDRLDMVANENYWREGEPYMKNLRLRFVGDQTSRSTEAKAKGADIIININPREEEAVGAVEGVEIIKAPATNTVYLMMNTKDPLLSDPAVREAVTYAINIPQTIELAYGNLGFPASGMVAPGVLGYDETMFEEHFGHGYDPETAKQILADAGYPDGIDLEVLVETGDTTRHDICEAFQAQMAPAGINMTITELDSVVLYDRVNAQNNHQLVLTGLTCSDYEADSMLNQILPGSSNIKMTNFDDPTFISMIEEGGTILDEAEREQAWKDTLTYLADANCMIPLWHKELIGAQMDYVEGFEMSPAFEEHFYQWTTLNK